MNATFFYYCCGLLWSIFALKVFRYHDYLSWAEQQQLEFYLLLCSLNLMPDKIASFPFKLLQVEEPNESEGPKPVVFLLLNEQWIREGLHVETRCFLSNAIFDALGKFGGLLCLPVFWPMQQDCLLWGLSVILPCFYPLAFLRKPVPEKCYCCDGVKNKV